MKKTKYIKKDIQFRSFFKQNEKKNKLFKSLFTDLRLKKNVSLNLTKQNLIIETNIVRINNRCILTGRGNFVLSFFKISRIKFRELVSVGALLGVRKSSW